MKIEGKHVFIEIIYQQLETLKRNFAVKKYFLEGFQFLIYIQYNINAISKYM